MSTSYIQEFAKIASVDDVYDIYELALLDKEASAAGREAAGAAEQLQAAKTMAPTKPMPPMGSTISQLKAKAPVGSFGPGKVVGRLLGMR